MEAKAGKATLYYIGDFGMGYRKLEVSKIEVKTAPYAQYADAVHVTFVPKGARKARGFVQGYKPTIVVLEGWGHPDPAPAFERVEDSTPGVQVSRSRHASFDEAWEHEFDEMLTRYVSAGGAKIVADMRAHRPSGERRAAEY